MTDSHPSLWLLSLLALLSGGLLALCFPPFGLYPLAWVALVPLLAALARTRRPRQGAWLGLLTGLAFFGALHRYLLMYGLLPTFLVALLEALPVVLFGFVAVHLSAARRRARPPIAALAGAWVLAEWLRANIGGLSLTFGQLGYSQQPSLPLLQSASLAGALGLSFLIVLLNAALAGALFPRHRRIGGRWAALVLAAALVGGVWTWGNRVLRRPLPSGPSLNVAVVQPNVELDTPVTAEDQEECLKQYPRYTDLLMAPYGSAEALRPDRPQLVVWPETALPLALNLEPFAEQVARLTARRHHIWLLLGALEVQSRPQGAAGGPAEVRTYNNAWLFDPDGVLRGTYSKNDLVPFGEYVPFRESLPFIQRYPVREFDFSPGAGRNLLEVEGRRCGALICFEAIFPGPSRELATRGADFLAFLTSDAWAGPSHEVLIHSQTAPLRAVETGRWVVRAAATGQSGIISPRGEWVDTVPPWHSGVAQAQLVALTGRTVYSRWGDWPLVVVALGLLLLGWRRRRRPR